MNLSAPTIGFSGNVTASGTGANAGSLTMIDGVLTCDDMIAGGIRYSVHYHGVTSAPGDTSTPKN